MTGSSPRLTRRQRQAEATRADILAAARHLFAEKGYVGTTVADIASRAEVAVQTIYSSVGSKADVLIALLEMVRAEAGLATMERKRASAVDPLELPRIGAHLRRRLMERGEDVGRVIVETAPFDPDVRRVWDQVLDMMRHGAVETVSRLRETGLLAPDMDPEKAPDLLFAIARPEVYMQLIDLGWTHDDIEHWIAHVVEKLFIDPDARPAS